MVILDPNNISTSIFNAAEEHALNSVKSRNNNYLDYSYQKEVCKSDFVSGVKWLTDNLKEIIPLYNGWIPVSNRLPIGSVSCIIYGRYTADSHMQSMEAIFFPKRRGFFIDSTRCKNVTHWMPLPASPKYNY